MSSQMQFPRPLEPLRMLDMAKKKLKGASKEPTKAKSATGEELIARNLKMVYDEIAAEPLPDALSQLLMQLDAQEARK